MNRASTRLLESSFNFEETWIALVEAQKTNRVSK
jgi:hypothetical protein